MSTISRYTTATLLLLSFTAAAGDDELQRLRSENAQLRAQLQSLRAQCPTAAKSGAVSGPIAAPNTPPGAAPETALPVPPPGYKLVKEADLPAPPPGYKLVKEAEPHSESGCRKGVFAQTADAPWKHEEQWNALDRGMKPAEVEKLLGDDHYNVLAKGRQMWQYGKCGNNVDGFVVFDGSEVLFWQAPQF